MSDVVAVLGAGGTMGSGMARNIARERLGRGNTLLTPIPADMVRIEGLRAG
jgi:hypothetical protein